MQSTHFRGGDVNFFFFGQKVRERERSINSYVCIKILASLSALFFLSRPNFLAHQNLTEQRSTTMTSVADATAIALVLDNDRQPIGSAAIRSSRRPAATQNYRGALSEYCSKKIRELEQRTETQLLYFYYKKNNTTPWTPPSAAPRSNQP